MKYVFAIRNHIEDYQSAWYVDSFAELTSFRLKPEFEGCDPLSVYNKLKNIQLNNSEIIETCGIGIGAITLDTHICKSITLRIRMNQNMDGLFVIQSDFEITRDDVQSLIDLHSRTGTLKTFLEEAKV